MTPIVLRLRPRVRRSVLSSPVQSSVPDCWGPALSRSAPSRLPSPALADQTLMVSDNARVDCIASSRDLTRISLVGDEIASVSKLQTGNPERGFLGRQRAAARRHLCLGARRLHAEAAVVLRDLEEGLCLQICLPVEQSGSPAGIRRQPGDRRRQARRDAHRRRRQIRRSKRSSWSRRCIRAASPMATGCGSLS